jgi:hypothetical protein
MLTLLTVPRCKPLVRRLIAVCLKPRRLRIVRQEQGTASAMSRPPQLMEASRRTYRGYTRLVTGKTQFPSTTIGVYHQGRRRWGRSPLAQNSAGTAPGSGLRILVAGYCQDIGNTLSTWRCEYVLVGSWARRCPLRQPAIQDLGSRMYRAAGRVCLGRSPPV